MIERNLLEILTQGYPKNAEEANVKDLIAFNNSDKHPLILYNQGEEGGKKFNSYFADTLNRITNRSFSEQDKVTEVLDSIIIKIFDEPIPMNLTVLDYLRKIYGGRMSAIAQFGDFDYLGKIYESHFGSTE